LRFEDSVSGFEENGTNLNDEEEEEESEDAREDATQRNATQRVRKTKQKK
jgi:hypothetical protein